MPSDKERLDGDAALRELNGQKYPFQRLVEGSGLMHEGAVCEHGVDAEQICFQCSPCAEKP